MLTTQRFVARPLIGLGPEMFRSPSSPVGVDFATLSTFRRKILNAVPLYSFVYVALLNSELGDQQEFSQTLQEMGMSFSQVCLIDEKDEKGAKDLVFALDALFSPEFSAKFTLPRKRVYDEESKSAFLYILSHFQTSGEPYDIERFRTLTDRLCETEKMTKSFASLRRS